MTKQQTSYRYTCRKGDLVWMPDMCRDKIGKIVSVRFVCGGDVQRVQVIPVYASRFKKFLHWLFDTYVFYDIDINDLIKIE